MRHVQPWGALLLTFSFLPYALAFPCEDHPLCDESCSCSGFKRLQYLGNATGGGNFRGMFMKMGGHTACWVDWDTHRFYLDPSGVLWVLRGCWPHGSACDSGDHLKCVSATANGGVGGKPPGGASLDGSGGFLKLPGGLLGGSLAPKLAPWSFSWPI